MFKKRNTKLPYRQPTEHERFMAFLRHEEREKARQGYETFEEANDFDCPDEPDPLERFFGEETKYQEAARFMDSILDNHREEQRIAADKADPLKQPLPIADRQGQEPAPVVQQDARREQDASAV